MSEQIVWGSRTLPGIGLARGVAPPDVRVDRLLVLRPHDCMVPVTDASASAPRGSIDSIGTVTLKVLSTGKNRPGRRTRNQQDLTSPRGTRPQLIAQAGHKPICEC